MLKIDLRLNTCRAEVECIVCGRPFVLGDVAAVACHEGGLEIGNLCNDCVRAGEAKIRQLLLSHATSLRQEGEELLQAAKFFEEAASGEIICPADEKWSEIIKNVKGE